MIDYVSKTMNLVFKMMNLVFKMMNLYQNSGGAAGVRRDCRAAE